MQNASLWLAVAVAALGFATISEEAPERAMAMSGAKKIAVLRKARGYRKETYALHRLMNRMRPDAFYRLDHGHPERTYMVWSGRLVRARTALHRPPHRRAWLCIHRHEGSWRDGGAPYWGGLQMDWSFMRTYAPRLLRLRGPANNWSPLEQMWVAERAYRSGRGFSPWPNTARMCGLL